MNGFLFNLKNAVCMADAIEKMLSLNESDYQYYCCNSRVRAENIFSKTRFVESYIKLIEQ